MCEEDTIRDLGSVVYREGREQDADDLWDGSWEDWVTAVRPNVGARLTRLIGSQC